MSCRSSYTKFAVGSSCTLLSENVARKLHSQISWIKRKEVRVGSRINESEAEQELSLPP